MSIAPNYLKGQHHFYQKNRIVPVTEQEKHEPEQRAKLSEKSLFFMGIVLFTALFCFIAIMLEVLGFHRDKFVWPIVLAWLASIMIFNFVIKSEKAEDAISGKIIGNR